LAKKGLDKNKGDVCPTCNETVPPDATECPSCGESLEDSVVKKKKTNVPFWVGLILIILGGPGISLGSWLHDLLRIPIGGDAFDVFGWLNRLVAAVGLIMMLVGMALLVWALAREAKEASEEG
jgi:predicted nucleic acid-binding Zn ribbon protein